MHGIVTSAVEVIGISARGIALRIGEEKLKLPYSQFPWFKGASEADIRAVECPAENHLYWPRLDIDLSVESVRNPTAFSLMSRDNR